MSPNLIELFSNAVGGPLVNAATSELGESKEGATKALTAMIPSLLGSVAQKGSTESGASGIMDMITKGGFDGSMLNNVSGLLSGGENTTNLMNQGNSIVSNLLGNKSNGFIDMITSFSGLKRSSTNSLLGAAAPLLMSIVGKQVAGKGISGLMDLLKGQSSYIEKAMPAGFNASGLLGFANKAGDAAKNVTSTASKTVTNTVKTAAGGPKKGGFMPWLISLLAILAVGYFVWTSGCLGKAGDAAANAAGAVTEVASEATGAVTDAAGNALDGAANMAEDAKNAAKDLGEDAKNAVADLGEGAKNAAKDLASNVSFAVGSIGDNITKMISNGTPVVGKTFKFENLTFDSGSSTINANTQVEVDNLAQILKAFPNMMVTVQGHTDNTGDAAANMALSQKRADAVKARLVEKGIDASRIDTKGYGQDMPTADNSSAEGRKANRRITVEVKSM